MKLTTHPLLRLQTRRFPQSRENQFGDVEPPPKSSPALRPALREKAVSPPYRVIIAGGITGGHLFPGIAIAEAFKTRDAQTSVLFVSVGNVLERSALSRSGFDSRWIRVEALKGRGLWKKLRSLLKLPSAIVQAIGILKHFQPDIVIGMGGYSSGPVVLAAWLTGIPIVLHEQNKIPGMTNRQLARFARRVYVSFDGTQLTTRPEKVRLTGNPIRNAFTSETEDADGLINGSAAENRFTVLVVGGSQGSHSINMAMIEALGKLKTPDRFYFIHQTGRADEGMVAGSYIRHGLKALVKPFFHRMAVLYRHADLVICRAGATTIAEVTAVGKPVLFIPYPYAADNHQTLNARAMADSGAADVLLEKRLSGQALANYIESLADEPERLERMAALSKAQGRPDAADRIVGDCYELLSEVTK